MPAYYLYRINSERDGFRPSVIPERVEKGMLRFNWRCYIENLDPGDVILAYFRGQGVRTGIYGVSVVRRIDLTTHHMNVCARLLCHSQDDGKPLIPVRGNEKLFRLIRTRMRGAEVVVPEKADRALFQALSAGTDVVAAARSWKVVLPGDQSYGIRLVSEVPLVELRSDLSHSVQAANLITSFWVRPRQASWMKRPPGWLLFITKVIKSFKSGDTSWLEALAESMFEQIRRVFPKPQERLGVVVGVPLNRQKSAAGEVDRVCALGRRLCSRLSVPFSEVFRLDGDISRRLYKNVGKTVGQFRSDYRINLKVRPTKPLLECIRSGRKILLLDDIYTDGVTTSTIIDVLHEVFPGELVDVQVATLAINAKKNNMEQDLIKNWSQNRG
ncbi:MAG: hypothetical protein KAT11_00045 [Phycisphaerae bacterium]|nr:hypothetical protein [Phycisphaerae bacterium]